ncbi:MAG: NUDIX hydrolase [Candidatus Thorarchaeota archaeon]|nr:MAG: NUDIX hydrolase [Candidatus Thorarchaeota archaeon]
MESKYGRPKLLHFETDFYDFECGLVKRSAAKGRHHDITCFIPHDNGYVVIQKPAYAGTGIFRAPSGGAETGESLEAAAHREMLEETGLETKLVRFVLDVRLKIHCSDSVIPWRSLVFLAESTSGEIVPIDKHEIFDAKVMTREELLGPDEQLMIGSGWGGFRYRAFLTRSFFEELAKP